MTLLRFKRFISLFMINNFLSGTRPQFFSIKNKLLNWAGYPIGNNTKIVGPIYIQGELNIGKNTWIGKNFMVNGNGSVVIGDNCDIAPEVIFLTGGHKIGSHERRAGLGETYSISVNDGCWVGARSTILGNTTIGSGTVVASCACVIGDIDSDVLVAGVPAKIKRGLTNV